MKTVWRFQLQLIDEQEIEMPKGAVPIKVGSMENEPCLWALVDDSLEYKKYKIYMFGTGHSIPAYLNIDYLGSSKITKFDDLIFHVFIESKKV